MVEKGRLGRIEVRLKALDPVEVGARPNPLDVGQPLVTNLGQRATEIEPAQRRLGRGDRFTGQDQLRGGKDASLDHAAH